MRRAALGGLALMALAALVVAAAVPDPLDPATAPGAVRRAIFRAESSRQAGDLAGAVRFLAGALADHADLDHAALRYRLGAYLVELGRATEALPPERFGQARAADIGFPLPLSRLQPGPYLVTIEVSRGGRTVRREVIFEVR